MFTRTGSGVATVFIRKGFARNPEIENTLVWVLSNIWWLGQVRDTEFGMSFNNKKLLPVAKCQD